MFFVTLFSKRMASEMSSANNAFFVDLSVQALLHLGMAHRLMAIHSPNLRFLLYVVPT